jgi:hypothetical protein
MNDVSLPEVVRNPEWLPHAYDPDGTLTFVDVPRDARSELMFLFDEHYAGRFRKAGFPAAAVAAELDPAVRAPLHFIFHTSFCGSSLLARALEKPGIATSMREPAIFSNLDKGAVDRNDQANANRLELVLRLLERPFSPGEAVVVKQTSFANRLLDQTLRARGESRAVLLYSDLETYLVALLKRGLKGRIWGRRLFTTLARWSPFKLDLAADEMLELTDMQVAALAWLLQIYHFDGVAKAFGPRAMLLDSNDMFAAPAKSLYQVMTFLDLDVTEQAAVDIAAGPIFAKHSKFSDRDYDVEDRRRDMELVGNVNAEELAMVTKWIKLFAEHHRAPLRPSA